MPSQTCQPKSSFPLTSTNMLLLLVLLILLATLPALIIFHLLPNRTKKHAEFHPPPGPKGLPLIGNLHQFDTSAPHLYLSKLAKIYGPILSLRLGCVPTVVIQSAELAKEVLKTQDHNFCSRPSRVGMKKLSYNELDIACAPYSDYLREIKKVCVFHLFSSKRIQSFAPVRKDEVLKMIDKVSSLSSASAVINFSNLVMAFSSSIICRLAFSKRYEDEGVGRSKFHTLLNEAQAMYAVTFFSDYLPLMGWLDKLMGSSSRLEKVFKDLDVFYKDIINEHLNQDRPKSDQQDIVDVLLKLQKDGSFPFELTLDNIKAVLMDILVAGTDTSAAMVVWAMTELIKNPLVIRKVQEELRTVNQGKSFFEEDDLPKLKYLKAVVKETFRLHPAAPLLVVHETLQKCRIEGYDIQPKTSVFVNAWAIGRDPKVWKDPELFMPERFLESKSHIDLKGQDFELIPFGAGRRICPGMNLGIAIFELALANLLLSFEWELPPGMKKEEIDINVIPGVTMHKKNPLCLVAKKYT